MYDTIIIGGGPGGVAAGVYAARKKLKVLLITQEFGGQSAVSASIENWIGEIKISGAELADKLEKHLRAQQGLKIKNFIQVIKIKKKGKIFTVITQNKQVFNSRTIILATGGRHRSLNISGEEKFKSKGVVYCSTCDAPIFKHKDVVVVGAGNSGLEAVIDLAPYADKVYLMEVLNKVKGDKILQDQIKHQLGKRLKIMLNCQPQEILGKQFVESLKYKDLKMQGSKELKVQGIFVSIGVVPNSEIAQGLVEIDKYGQIVVDPKRQATNQAGVYAVGDVTDGLYRQNNISARDGVVAALSAYDYLIKYK